jgi:RNA recognition motif-containing protein
MMKVHRTAQKRKMKLNPHFTMDRKRKRRRSPSSPDLEDPSFSSSSRSSPPQSQKRKKKSFSKERKPQTSPNQSAEEEDTMSAELFSEESKKVLSRLQVRFADGELERLGIVNLGATGTNVSPEQCSKLYVCHIAKDKTFDDINKVFSTVGEIEELYLFKESNISDDFKGSCFIKYSTRKEALKAIYKFN